MRYYAVRALPHTHHYAFSSSSLCGILRFEAILKEVKSNKPASTATNPRSDINEMQDSQPSGSKTNRFIGVRASNIESTDSENDDYPLEASKMKDLKHPAKPLFQNESDVDVTILSNEESDVEDYHTRAFGTNH